MHPDTPQTRMVDRFIGVSKNAPWVQIFAPFGTFLTFDSIYASSFLTKFDSNLHFCTQICTLLQSNLHPGIQNKLPNPSGSKSRFIKISIFSLKIPSSKELFVIRTPKLSIIIQNQRSNRVPYASSYSTLSI